ncbi:potassium-transporting ATPase subunit KdpA [Methanosarcina barkeri]
MHRNVALLLFPIAFVFSIVLTYQGVVQNLDPHLM